MNKTLSYVCNPRQSPFMYKTIIDALRESVTKTPEKECLIYRGLNGSRESLTYKELDSNATSLAKVLVAKGVTKGDRVALLGPNTIEKAVAEVAIIMSGGVVVHVTMNLTDNRDVVEIFKIAACRLLLVDPGKDETNMEYMYQIVALFSSGEIMKGVDNPPLLFLRPMKCIQPCLDISKISKTDINTKLPKLYPEDVVLVWTTSGSTGKPKMVPHSHFDLINICRSENELLDIFYTDRPFGWFAGSPSVRISLHSTHVFTDTSTAIKGHSTLDIWKIIKEEKCTAATLLPYFLKDLIQIKNEYKDSFQLDLIFTGGQIIDKHYTEVVNVFTKVLMVGCGSTEALRLTLHKIFSREDGLIAGDVGIPFEGVEAKVVDRHGNVTQRCESGEICFRSHSMFKGNYKNESGTKEYFLDGQWFRSGDMGYITKDDRIVIQGRVKDVISRGTRKIMPATLESVIIEMEGLDNVIVVPVPDKRLYEEVCVCFISNKNYKIEEEDVRTFCEKMFTVESSGDGLGQRPKYYLKFESFPQLITGKFDKKEIRIQASGRLMINLQN